MRCKSKELKIDPNKVWISAEKLQRSRSEYTASKFVDYRPKTQEKVHQNQQKTKMRKYCPSKSVNLTRNSIFTQIFTPEQHIYRGSTVEYSRTLQQTGKQVINMENLQNFGPNVIMGNLEQVDQINQQMKKEFAYYDKILVQKNNRNQNNQIQKSASQYVVTQQSNHIQLQSSQQIKKNASLQNMELKQINNKQQVRQQLFTEKINQLNQFKNDFIDIRQNWPLFIENFARGKSIVKSYQFLNNFTKMLKFARENLNFQAYQQVVESILPLTSFKLIIIQLINHIVTPRLSQVAMLMLNRFITYDYRTDKLTFFKQVFRVLGLDFISKMLKINQKQSYAQIMTQFQLMLVSLDLISFGESGIEEKNSIVFNCALHCRNIQKNVDYDYTVVQNQQGQEKNQTIEQNQNQQINGQTTDIQLQTCNIKQFDSDFQLQPKYEENTQLPNNFEFKFIKDIIFQINLKVPARLLGLTTSIIVEPLNTDITQRYVLSFETDVEENNDVYVLLMFQDNGKYYNYANNMTNEQKLLVLELANKYNVYKQAQKRGKQVSFQQKVNEQLNEAMKNMDFEEFIRRSNNYQKVFIDQSVAIPVNKQSIYTTQQLNNQVKISFDIYGGGRNLIINIIGRRSLKDMVIKQINIKQYSYNDPLPHQNFRVPNAVIRAFARERTVMKKYSVKKVASDKFSYMNYQQQIQENELLSQLNSVQKFLKPVQFEHLNVNNLQYDLDLLFGKYKQTTRVLNDLEKYGINLLNISIPQIDITCDEIYEMVLTDAMERSGVVGTIGYLADKIFSDTLKQIDFKKIRSISYDENDDQQQMQ